MHTVVQVEADQKTKRLGPAFLQKAQSIAVVSISFLSDPSFTSGHLSDPNTLLLSDKYFSFIKMKVIYVNFNDRLKCPTFIIIHCNQPSLNLMYELWGTPCGALGSQSQG